MEHTLRRWMRLVEGHGPIPYPLYHATFEHHLPSIMQHGLGAMGKRNFEISRHGVVYLSDDPDAAEAYVLNAQFNIGDQVLLQIDTRQLDAAKFRPDQNDEGEYGYGGSSYEYHGIIPPSAIERI